MLNVTDIVQSLTMRAKTPANCAFDINRKKLFVIFKPLKTISSDINSENKSSSSESL